MFLPTSREEMQQLGWSDIEVVLVTGDAYIDAPSVGVALIGKILLDAGYRVGLVAQPDPRSGEDIGRLGAPSLFWGVTAGCVDSMVANYTSSGRRRRSDDYTPGGRNERRPDRAVIVYSQLVRRYFKSAAPIVLGGLEASLRRVAHYDFRANRIRRSVLFDAKADYLLYGMADRSVLELADCLRRGARPESVRGLCYIAAELPDGSQRLPSFAEAAADKAVFTEMFHTFYRNQDPVSGARLAQLHDTRYLIQNPPARPLNEAELDRVYALDFERELHPGDRARGTVRALETIRFSITSHRGCYGECNFCAIAVHQGRTVCSRSLPSLIAEARTLAAHPQFKGVIHDVGGATANMYGMECERKASKGACPHRRCLFPRICAELNVSHRRQIEMLRALRHVPGVRKVVVASGIRHDLALADREWGRDYLAEVVRHHVSGQMKIAPEHVVPAVLTLMGKPSADLAVEFRRRFEALTHAAGKEQFPTYYMIAAHPGCRLEDMESLRRFAREQLNVAPRQIQVFTPTPSTYSTLMYWTEKNPFTGEPIFVEKTERGRAMQKSRALPPQRPARR
jgi:uncharacterized radical SAM protein YgiQ